MPCPAIDCIHRVCPLAELVTEKCGHYEHDLKRATIQRAGRSVELIRAQDECARLRSQLQSAERERDELKAQLAKAQRPRLARHQPCGCIACDCSDDDQCHGCGAQHCGTHPVGEIPNAVYEPHPLDEKLRCAERELDALKAALAARDSTIATMHADSIEAVRKTAGERDEARGLLDALRADREARIMTEIDLREALTGLGEGHKRWKERAETAEAALIEVRNQRDAATADADKEQCRAISAEARAKALEDFARDCRDNWDCDADSHAHGTACRCCDARALLASKETDT